MLVNTWKVPIPVNRPRFAFADRGIAVGEQAKRRRRHDPGYDDPQTLSATVGGRKAVLEFKGGAYHYYDLTTDPLETRPLPKPRWEKSNSAFNQLVNFYRRLEKYVDSDRPEVSPDDIQLLRDLGYVDEQQDAKPK